MHRILTNLVPMAILLLTVVCSMTCADTKPYSALIVKGPDSDNALVNQVAKKISDAGYTTAIKDIAVFDKKSMGQLNYDLIVLCDASQLPRDAFDLLWQHFRNGGDLFALNAPLWQKLLVNIDGRWVDRSKYLTDNAFNVPESTVFDFSKQSVDGWHREAHDSTIASTFSVEDDKDAQRKVLRVTCDDLQGYDSYRSDAIENAFPDGNTLTMLSARGIGATTQLAVRWEEKDGTSWTSVIPLSSSWRLYMLRPEDFKWSGGNQDRKDGKFNPAEASRLSVGLSWGDTGQILGKHEYRIGWIGTSKDSDAYNGLTGGSIIPPDFDVLSPDYKFFDMNGVTTLATSPGQALIPSCKLPVPKTLLSAHQRPQGNGFDKGRDWRWIPLLQGNTAKGEWRGTPASMLVYGSGDYAGSMWTSFGIQDHGWYQRPEALDVISKVAGRMRNGVFMMDAGADCYTYMTNQPIRLGMKLANLSKDTHKNLKSVIKVIDNDTGKVVYTKSWNPILEPGASKTDSIEWKVTRWPVKGFRVSAELFENNKLIDKAGHNIYPWKPSGKKSFVTCENGEFRFNGKRWIANGVNYHPSSTVATWDWNLFLEWFGKRSYDPEVIERDLHHMNDMGINAVSIQVCFSKPPMSDNLLDFLRRLKNHGIRANLALPLSPMTQLEERWPYYKDIIQKYGLKDVDTIIAYDIDWEPIWNTPEYRRQWDGDWQNWIIERYGSIENAEKDWGFPVPRDASGNITNPPAQHIQRDGEWRKMAAAYRRFLDTMLYRQYSTARRYIREVDPNHPVSFRMHAAGDGGSGWYGLLPYDWPYLAAAVDFFGPEAYTLGKTWDSIIKRGLFTKSYARWADENKPMIYAEAGYSLIEYPGELTSRSDAMQNQARFYNDFYRMMTSGSVNGVFWWWYPGGFRCMENSDYGIINPDGSDRPVTKIIRERAKILYSAQPLKKGKTITVDPDAYISSSTAGSIYDQVKDEFWAEVDKGYLPEFATSGKGTDSSNCPLIAVGNTPCNGSNPPKYLDALFDVVEVRQDGKWVHVKKDSQVSIDFAKPIYVRFQLTNLGEAGWVSDNTRDGGVSLQIKGRGIQTVQMPHDLPHLKSISIGPVLLETAGITGNQQIELSLDARKRTQFGEIFRFVVKNRE